MANDRKVFGEFLTAAGPILGVVALLVQFGCMGTDPKRAEQAMVHYQVAQDLAVKGESTQSMSEALKASELDPKNAQIQGYVGLLFYQRGEIPRAEQYLKKATRLDPNYSEAQNNLCVLLSEKGKYDDALRHCTKAVENVTYATPERAYHNMGVAYERKGDLPKAIDSYRKGLIHNKNYVRILRSLAVIHLNQNNPKEALPLLETASEACNKSPKGVWGPDCPETHYRLAMIYLQMKKRDRVAIELKNCVAADDEKGVYGQKCRSNLKVYQ